MQTVASDQLLHVADDILNSAARSGLRPGNRLPTERELATNLQLTRTTIRNAMALLEDEGIVSREVGRGTFLRSDPRHGLFPDAGVPPHASIAVVVSPADVMTARQLIEPAAIASIVENATVTDFEEIERCLRGNENAADYDEFERWDFALHRSFIRAAHNPLMESMYELVEEARQGETWGNLKRRSDSTERRANYRTQHRAIAEALRNRDGRGAREAMQLHLSTVEANLQKSAQS
ncbi:MAG TPA: FCD domain-containing protein [Acidimicrobiales bacterium]|nr:FCD domain-containing protein [Acidimicrobiales bacterium]